MRKFFAILLFVCILDVLHAQNTAETAENPSLDPSQVPQAAVNNYTKENPGIAATWRRDGDNYRVNYIDPTAKLGRIIIYDNDGKVVRRENEVDNMTYPLAIKEYYTKNHPGELFQVWTSQNKNNGESMYYSSRNTETIWFDKDGNVVSEKKAKKAVTEPREKK